MSSAVARNTPSLNVPATQNTAPVLEFRCLYTHDLRRKSKRWQDGGLRYHTFNKRIMVYDTAKNYIGDKHWHEDDPIQNGDEMTLDKGVIVQVGEAVGSTETDLTPLFQKKTKESPQREARVQGNVRPGPSMRTGTAGGQTQHRHRPLTALLGTNRGLQGKAVLPTKSPFEAR
ncbi:hypothetical protein K402DRAFT_332474, partial [Aulographum hederae CBS 113979]